MQLPPVHLAIMQPAGYIHALAFVDHARYFRHHFRRLGATVTIGKNRLREDAINFVFGAHLGFPVEWTKRHACVFVNLEQLGDGGAQVSPEYLKLLRHAAVCDYDADNVAAYARDAADVPLVSFLHAPYLHDAAPIPLAERPIDLLFFGSMNARRQAFMQRIEACGVNVASFDHAVYGPERDDFVRQAKAVINCHFYEASRFEQARVFQCLSLGTPVISERGPRTRAPAAYDDAVFWLDGEDAVERFFRDRFTTPAFCDEAAVKLAAFARHDPIEAYADLLAFGVGYAQAHRRIHPDVPWRPTHVNLGSGKDYKPGWLNIDILERAQPDIVLDLGQPVEWPVQRPALRGGEVLLEPGSVDLVYANNVLEHVPDLPCLMTNLLALLKEGGELHVEVPYEKAATAWQDPTHVRAMNEQSWLYYTGWFWYLGWFEHRFEIASSGWLDLQLQPCAQAQAAFMKLTLRKIQTTPHERTVARTMQADFGGLDADEGVPDDAVPAPAAAPQPAAASPLPAAIDAALAGLIG